ncbi:MAG: arginyltransferase [Ectothiorhodospiraceae bacterium]|jgi:arginine-tRNA-protein transferase
MTGYAREKSFALFTTGSHDCPYLPGRVARTAFVDPHSTLSTDAYAALIQRGFRRSGPYLYRPACPACRACQTLRIPVREFAPKRRHRRCLQRNRGVVIRALAPLYRPEHFELYRRYIAARHPGGSMDDPTEESYQGFLSTEWCDTEFLEMRENGRLLGVAVVDNLDGALSAVYTFYEPGEPRRSLGTLAILLEIREAARRGKDYLYLGYWIPQCERMAYKADFRPHEVLNEHGDWRRVF